MPAEADVVFRSQIQGTPLPAPPYSFAWDFGDGQRAQPPATSEPQNQVQHTYGEAGPDANRAVKLRVTDGLGAGQDVTCPTVAIGPARPGLYAQCTVAPTSGPAPLTVRFLVSQKANCDGGCRFSWDFGDRTAYTGGDVDHVYDAPGAYVARGTLRDDTERRFSCEHRITVTAPPPPPAPPTTPAGNTPPSIGPISLAASPPGVFSVRMSATITDPDPGDTLTWRIEVVSGPAGATLTPATGTGGAVASTFTGAQGAVYSVRITASDGRGGTSTREREFEVPL